MSKILVTYASLAGSTREVAENIADELAYSEADIEVHPISQVSSLEGYDAVVVGGPMIMGWHREALGFLKQHRAALQHIPMAVFVLAMSLTNTGETSVRGLPIWVDEKLPHTPIQPNHLTLRERYARLTPYLNPIFQACAPARPVSLAVFGGRVEYGRLPWWAVLFAMAVIQAPSGDLRNWPTIRAWAAGLPTAFRLQPAAPVTTSTALPFVMPSQPSAQVP